MQRTCSKQPDEDVEYSIWLYNLRNCAVGKVRNIEALHDCLTRAAFKREYSAQEFFDAIFKGVSFPYTIKVGTEFHE